MKKVNLAEAATQIEGYWNPLIVGELNNQMIKLARLKGEFDWHHHENEDECFLVLEGEFEMHMRGEILPIKKGEFFIVPRTVEHRPVAKNEALVMLFEPNSTVNTGNVETEKTRLDIKRYQPGSY